MWVEPKIVADLYRRPAVVQALQTAARADEATLRVWLVSLGRRSAVERLAHLFCELYMRLCAVELAEGQSYPLPLTQLDLADTIGITPVHLSRSVGALTRMGLIERMGKDLKILELPRLIEVAEFHADYLQLGEAEAGPTRRHMISWNAPNSHTHLS